MLSIITPSFGRAYKLPFLAVLLVLVQGCSTYGKISGLPSEGQKSIYKDGRKSILSVKNNTVSIAPEVEKVASGARGSFVLAVKNGTNQDLLFSPENILATTKNSKDGSISALKVFTYNELVEEEETRQAWAAFGAALQGAADQMNAANAGYSNTYGTYSGSAYSNYGTSAYGYGTYSSSTYDYGAVQAAQSTAQAQSDARMARLRSEGEANLRQLAATILKKQTVFPGSWHGGLAEIQLPEITEDYQTIDVVVDVGGEEHTFIFAQQKIDD